MLRALDSPEVQERAGAWLVPFVADFRSRFALLLPGPFKAFKPAIALGLLDPQLSFTEAETAAGIARGFVPVRGDGSPFSPYDMKRLQVCYALCPCCSSTGGWLSGSGCVLLTCGFDTGWEILW